jgi:hypothetical protein
MERLFSPCTRLHDILESAGSHFRRPLQELKLDVSNEELLSAERAFTYADLYALLGNESTVLWLTPTAAVVPAIRGKGVSSCWELEDSCHMCFSVDGQKMIAFAHSPEHSSEICDVVLRLSAASVVHSVRLRKLIPSGGAVINAPTLAYLTEQCQSLKALTLERITLDENHCRVLGAYSRPDLEIALSHCKLTSDGTSALAEVLGRNQGPTKLEFCVVDNIIIADGLRGNSRLKSFRQIFSDNSSVSNRRELVAIAGAVRENKGLVRFEMKCNGFRANDETWGAVCDSLKTHPTLEVLDLFTTFIYTLGGAPPMAPDVITSRIQALVDMMKMNMSIHTIYLDLIYSETEMYRESVIPYLETNRFRPRLLAIQKSRPITCRAKVLRRALLALRTDPNRFWMFLSGNAEVAFPSTTATTTPAANLPTLTVSAN